jgi:hypothetical protein
VVLVLCADSELVIYIFSIHKAAISAEI